MSPIENGADMSNIANTPAEVALDLPLLEAPSNFEILYRTYYPTLCDYAFRQGARDNIYTAEDVVHAVFTRWGGLQPVDSPAGYFATAVRREIGTRRRNISSTPISPEEVAAKGEQNPSAILASNYRQPEDVVMSRVALEIVVKTFLKLNDVQAGRGAHITEQQRDVFLRHFVKNQSVQDIAQVLHMSENTVSSLLSRTRRALKSSLARNHPDILEHIEELRAA